ncbi:hypothetical protein B0H14DRAFT_2197185, partial [Mycena olivaceomarginata]
GSVVCPGDAPTWFQKGFEEVSRRALGPRYNEILREFIAMEQSVVFASDGKAKGFKGTAAWPSQVADWIRDGRGRTQAVRTIADIDAFEKTWWEWWNSMQPEWRASWTKEGATAVLEGADWGPLTAAAAAGQNGMLSVVATLYWWGCA